MRGSIKKDAVLVGNTFVPLILYEQSVHAELSFEPQKFAQIT